MAFVYLLASGGGWLSSKSKGLFKDIQSGRITGVVSTFTISEYLSVVRDALAEKRGTPPSRQEIAAAEKNLMEFLENIGIELRDADTLATSASPFFEDVHQIVASSSSVRRTRDREWSGPGGADAVVAALAIRMTATQVATFDEGFRGLTTHGLTPLMIGEAY